MTAPRETPPRLTADDVASGFERTRSVDGLVETPLPKPDAPPADSPEARLRVEMATKAGAGLTRNIDADIAAVLDRLEGSRVALASAVGDYQSAVERLDRLKAENATLRAERDAAVEALKPSRQAILLKGVASERDEAQAEVKRLDADLAAARATVEAQGWQPIASAPKMRTILLFAVTDVDANGEVRNWKMATGSWHSGYDDEQSRSKGYTPWTWDGDQLKAYQVQPTHWQPLPPAPSDPQE